nr:MAG TPA: hypothetical protein [Caudoviricetes sp.]
MIPPPQRRSSVSLSETEMLNWGQQPRSLGSYPPPIIRGNSNEILFHCFEF